MTTQPEVEPSASSEQPKLTKLSQSGQFYSKGNDRADLSEQGQFLYWVILLYSIDCDDLVILSMHILIITNLVANTHEGHVYVFWLDLKV